MMKKTYFLIMVSCLALIACSGNRTTKPSPKTSTSNTGGYYGTDGPHAKPPGNLDEIPDAIPKVETLYKFSSKPYVALGEKYVPLKTGKGYKMRGVASWYGKMFHGKKQPLVKLMTCTACRLPIRCYRYQVMSKSPILRMGVPLLFASMTGGLLNIKEKLTYHMRLPTNCA